MSEERTRNLNLLPAAPCWLGEEGCPGPGRDGHHKEAERGSGPGERPVMHMIGNAHIDPVWLWQWPEGFHEVLATFRSALDRMAEYPDFTFTASSAAFYEWVEQVDPAMFEEIRARVAEGRWEIVGGWWVEPDCNVPGGESFARQALYGQRYFHQKFGVMAHVGFNADSFGHHGMLPQILKKSGLDSYVFLRPGPHEKGLPGRLFWWESDDGSRVLAFRIPFEYCTWGQDLENHLNRCAGEMKEPVTHFMSFYGVGNHGGGPTRDNIESIRRIDGAPGMPRLAFSTTSAFFEAVTGAGWSLPVVHDDLQHHASGCYSAHSDVKHWNRRAENALLRAEKWSALASWAVGQPYPPDLGRAWKNVLFNQFHDILAGTSVEAAYEDAQHLYGEAMAIAGRALNAAVQSIAWRVRAPRGEPTSPFTGERVRPIAVFNAHGWPVRAPVELEIGGLSEDQVLVDDQGHPVAMQRVQSQATAGGRSRICFLADLPALGYRVYRLVPGTPAEGDDGSLQAGETHLENRRLRLTFDPQTGHLASLYDKETGVEVLAGPAARPVVLHDAGDTWCHNIFRFDEEAGTFGAARIRVDELGPVRAVLRVESSWGASHLVQRFTLYRELDRVEVQASADWREQHKVLKLRFPVNVKYMKITHEIPYGRMERFANGEEEPIQSWLDISGTARDVDVPYGLSVLNDGKYSVDVNVRDIGLTVLRSPIYAHHVPAEPQPGRDYTFVDQGLQRFTYALLPHGGSWEQAGTVRHAAELNQQPVALAASLVQDDGSGGLPLAASFLQVQPDNILVTALKQAEDGGGLVLRAVETAGRTTPRATIRLAPVSGGTPRTVEAAFHASEIKTWYLPQDCELPVAETNLIENPLPEP
jgi:alpha-mannosidase